MLYRDIYYEYAKYNDGVGGRWTLGENLNSEGAGGKMKKMEGKRVQLYQKRGIMP